jgi:hypothetical protein
MKLQKQPSSSMSYMSFKLNMIRWMHYYIALLHKVDTVYSILQASLFKCRLASY